MEDGGIAATSKDLAEAILWNAAYLTVFPASCMDSGGDTAAPPGGIPGHHKRTVLPAPLSFPRIGTPSCAQKHGSADRKGRYGRRSPSPPGCRRSVKPHRKTANGRARSLRRATGTPAVGRGWRLKWVNFPPRICLPVSGVSVPQNAREEGSKPAGPAGKAPPMRLDGRGCAPTQNGELKGKHPEPTRRRRGLQAPQSQEVLRPPVVSTRQHVPEPSRRGPRRQPRAL